jgi:hypothetical protein
MPRPVTGYLTSQGKYFDSEREATLYELSFEVNKQIRKYLKAIGVTGEYEEGSANQILAFIIDNETLLSDYLLARRASEDEQSYHEVVGSTEPVNTEVGPSVRVSDDIQLDENTNAEDTSSGVGKKTKREAVR